MLTLSELFWESFKTSLLHIWSNSAAFNIIFCLLCYYKKSTYRSMSSSFPWHYLFTHIQKEMFNYITAYMNVGLYCLFLDSSSAFNYFLLSMQNANIYRYFYRTFWTFCPIINCKELYRFKAWINRFIAIIALSKEPYSPYPLPTHKPHSKSNE